MINHQSLGGYPIFQTSPKVPGKDVDGLRAMPAFASESLDGLICLMFSQMFNGEQDGR